MVVLLLVVGVLLSLGLQSAAAAQSAQIQTEQTGNYNNKKNQTANQNVKHSFVQLNLSRIIA